MRFSKITRGFSLLELLVTLAIAAILLGLAWPAWRQFAAAARGRALLRQLGAALQFTRQEAVLRRETVALCGSSDQKSCSGSWGEGLLVFVDVKQNGKLEDPGQIIHSFHLGRQDGILHWRAFPAKREVCQFLPSGDSQHENGSFWYCAAGKKEASWALILSQAGRIRVSYPNRDGQIQDEKGRPLLCEVLTNTHPSFPTP